MLNKVLTAAAIVIFIGCFIYGWKTLGSRIERFQKISNDMTEDNFWKSHWLLAKEYGKLFILLLICFGCAIYLSLFGFRF